MSFGPDFDTLKETAEKYRNWGRWGPDDQIGTLNFITPQKIVQATQLVRKGKTFSLAIPFDEQGPQSGRNRRFNPKQLMIVDGRDTAAGPVLGTPPGFGFADDVMIMPTHGATHWDALAHVFWDHKMWNGRDASLVSSLGAERNGIENYRDRVVSRGVLLDVARVKDVDCLEMGYPITGADLDAAADLGSVQVGTGDIVLVRTGYTGYCRVRGSWGDYAGGTAPGLSFWTVGWLHNHEVAGVALDTWGAEVRPSELDAVSSPWHKVALTNMGLLVGELFDLEDLAADCAADGVYEFLFCAPPLPLTGGVGSPINPVAVK